MFTVLHQLPPIGPREEELFHFIWVLDCLEPGVMAEIDACRFRRLFGVPGVAAFKAAEAIALSTGCRFDYRPTTEHAIFSKA